MNHHFDVDHAQLYGLHEAIMIENFSHWIALNRAEGRHLIEGRTWTYNTVEAILRYYPYLSTWSVRSALKNLIEAGVLLVGNFNKVGRDQTKWYAFADEDRFVPRPRADAAEKALAREARAAEGVLSRSSAKPSAHLRNSTNGNSEGDEAQTLDGGPSAQLLKTTNGPSAHLRNSTTPFVESHKSTNTAVVNTVIKNNAGASARAGVLPDDWVLPDEWAQWARENRPEWSGEWLEIVAGSFHEHWRDGGPTGEATADDKRASWQTRWRSWVREAPDTPAEDEPPPPEVEQLKNWFLSEEGVAEQARRCGLSANVGESAEAFKQRIKDHLSGKKPKKQKVAPPKQFPSPVPLKRDDLPPEQIASYLDTLKKALAKGKPSVLAAK